MQISTNLEHQRIEEFISPNTASFKRVRTQIMDESNTLVTTDPFGLKDSLNKPLRIEIKSLKPPPQSLIEQNNTNIKTNNKTHKQTYKQTA